MRSHIREVKHNVYGKRQTVDSCVSQKRENLRFSTCLSLLRSHSIYLVNKQERSLIKSSFSVFWQKGNFALPFAVNREVKHDALEQKHLKKTFEKHVMERGYPQNFINNTLSEVKFQERTQDLIQQNKKKKRILPCVTQYHPTVPNFQEILTRK